MAIRLGTVAPVGFDDFASPRWIDLMKQLGCRSVQVYRNRNGNDAEHSGPVTTAQMQEYVDMTGLPCDSIHGLYGNDLDISTPDEAARHAALDVMKSEGDLAKALGGSLVVVHCSGIFQTSVSQAEYRTRRDQLRRSIDALAEIGEQLDVCYAIENLPPYHAIGADVAELAGLCRDADSERIGLCYDVAHANLSTDPVQAVRQTAGQCVYMHICDNAGKTDDHLMPYAGQIDWLAFARALREIDYDGIAMLETFYSVDRLEALVADGWSDRLAEFVNAANGLPVTR